MKQYSFLNEANWAQFAHNTIGAAQRSSALKGAGYGALVGGGANVVRNAMKKDNDPTKKGSIRAAFNGAAAGAGTGAALGWAGGRLARSGMGQSAQNTLAQKAVSIHGDQAGKKAIAALGDKAFKDGNLTQQAQQAFDDAKSTAVKQASIVKGAGSLTRHGINKGRFLKFASDTQYNIPVQG